MLKVEEQEKSVANSKLVAETSNELEAKIEKLKQESEAEKSDNNILKQQLL